MGQYTCWDSFGPKKRKLILLTLLHRAIEICSPEKFSSEVNKIKNILQQKERPRSYYFQNFKKNSNFQTPQAIQPKKVSSISKITLDWKRFP